MASNDATLHNAKAFIKMIDDTITKAKASASPLYTTHLPDIANHIKGAMSSDDAGILGNLKQFDDALAPDAHIADGSILNQFVKLRNAVKCLHDKVSTGNDVVIAAADVSAFYNKLGALENDKIALSDFLLNKKKEVSAQGASSASKGEGGDGKPKLPPAHEHSAFATYRIQDDKVVVHVVTSTPRNGFFTLRDIARKEREYKLGAQCRQQMLRIPINRYGLTSHTPSLMHTFLSGQDRGAKAVADRMAKLCTTDKTTAASTSTTLQGIAAQIKQGEDDKNKEKLFTDLAALTPDTFDTILSNVRPRKARVSPLGGIMELTLKNFMFTDNNKRHIQWDTISNAKKAEVSQLTDVVTAFEAATVALNADEKDASKHVTTEQVWQYLFPAMTSLIMKLYIALCKESKVKMGSNDAAPCLYFQQTHKSTRNIAMIAWLDEKIHQQAKQENAQHALSSIAKRVKGAVKTESKLKHMKNAHKYITTKLANGNAADHVKAAFHAELKNRAIGYATAKNKAGDNNACRFDDDLKALKELVNSGVFNKACGKQVSWSELIKPWANERPANK